jgi:hypothetical protein
MALVDGDVVPFLVSKFDSPDVELKDLVIGSILALSQNVESLGKMAKQGALPVLRTLAEGDYEFSCTNAIANISRDSAEPHGTRHNMVVANFGLFCRLKAQSADPRMQLVVSLTAANLCMDSNTHGYALMRDML